MEKTFIIIGKYNSNTPNGPSGVIRELYNETKKNHYYIRFLLYKQGTSKTIFCLNIIITILKSKNVVINVHTDGFLIPLIVYCCSILKKDNSYYLSVHGVYRIESKIKGHSKKPYLLLESILYKKFSNIIVVSEMLKDNIEKLYNRKKNIYVIPNGTNARSDKQPDYEICDRTIRFISVGGLGWRKGIEDLIAFCVKLDDKGIDYSVNIYGYDSGNGDWFNNKLNDYGIAKKVKYCGLLKEKQNVFDNISVSDFHLCLSKYDTFNIAIIESLVLGCPVIATDTCGAASLISGDSGVVLSEEEIRTNNYDKAIEYINRICSKDGERRKIYDDKMHFCEELSWNKVVKQYLSLE